MEGEGLWSGGINDAKEVDNSLRRAPPVVVLADLPKAGEPLQDACRGEGDVRRTSARRALPKS